MRTAYGLATILLSGALVVLGVVMIVGAVAGGGGPLANGVVVGVLFCAAGVARILLTRGGS